MRRRVVLSSVAITAVATGAGWAWWRNVRNLSDAGGEPAEADLWSSSFATPSGGELAMSTLRGKPLVLNFWATWCAPCLHEMPQIDRFHREFGPRSWQVLGIALDRAGPVNEFLARRPVGFPTVLAGAEGFDLIHRLGNGRGVLPFTVVFDGSGRVARSKVGETNFEELAGWARTIGTLP